jgi:hypothetical protein
MNVQPFLFGDGWIEVRDANDTARDIFRRHYSARNKKPKHLGFAGLGQKMVLLTADAKALFVWRYNEQRDDGQDGVNCAVFRNEGPGLSSDLIRTADALADARWPGERHFTFVNAAAVASRNPGYCFLVAGWRRCGRTKARGYHILERVAA